MSILIKGMGMPESCYDCEIRIKCGCMVANASGWLNNKIDDHCPFAFVEVPKHGRLIDADALCEALLARWDTADKNAERIIAEVMADVVTPIVASAPTIIEAEE